MRKHNITDAKVTSLVQRAVWEVKPFKQEQQLLAQLRTQDPDLATLLDQLRAPSLSLRVPNLGQLCLEKMHVFRWGCTALWMLIDATSSQSQQIAVNTLPLFLRGAETGRLKAQMLNQLITISRWLDDYHGTGRHHWTLLSNGLLATKEDERRAIYDPTPRTKTAQQTDQLETYRGFKHGKQPFVDPETNPQLGEFFQSIENLLKTKRPPAEVIQFREQQWKLFVKCYRQFIQAVPSLEQSFRLYCTESGELQYQQGNRILTLPWFDPDTRKSVVPSKRRKSKMPLHTLFLSQLGL